jgi:hypothetical protein
LDKERNSKRGIQIMWKFGGRTGQRLSKKLKYPLRNYKMRMKSSSVVTLALGSQPRQGLAKVRAKRRKPGSHILCSRECKRV